MVDDDQQYILQKMYTKEERIEQAKLYDQMITSYTLYVRELQEGYTVL